MPILLLDELAQLPLVLLESCGGAASLDGACVPVERTLPLNEHALSDAQWADEYVAHRNHDEVHEELSKRKGRDTEANSKVEDAPSGTTCAPRSPPIPAERRSGPKGEGREVGGRRSVPRPPPAAPLRRLEQPARGRRMVTLPPPFCFTRRPCCRMRFRSGVPLEGPTGCAPDRPRQKDGPAGGGAGDEAWTQSRRQAPSRRRTTWIFH